MRAIATAFLLALLAISGPASTPVMAQDGVLTFTFTNDAPYTIFMKMYSQDRNWAWPSGTTHYLLDDDQAKSARIACNVGEKVCFGGGYDEKDSSRWWGVGYRGNKSCKDCCLVCGPADENREHHWRLIE